MDKALNEMTNEELWQLFPIILCEHSPLWKEQYAREKTVIEQAVGIHNIARINHIGSTAVANLTAKPTVDILLEIKEETDIVSLISSLQSAGYIYSEQKNNPPPHMMFMKGYTPHGFKERVFHVHVRYCGDWDELYFRDYLTANPDTADEYGKLKLELQKEYEHDRDGYTDAKTEFIKRITQLAKRELKYKP